MEKLLSALRWTVKDLTIGTAERAICWIKHDGLRSWIGAVFSEWFPFIVTFMIIAMPWRLWAIGWLAVWTAVALFLLLFIPWVFFLKWWAESELEWMITGS